MLNKKKKFIIVLLLACVFTTSIGVGLLSKPKETKALVPGAMTQTLELYSVPQERQTIWTKIWNALKDALKVAGDIAYKNSLKYFLQRVAYDTATYIATGGAGQKPLFISEGWGKYFQNVGDEAVGVFFEELAKPRTLQDGYCDTATQIRCSRDSQCPKDELGPGVCILATTWKGLGVDLCEPLEGQIKVDITLAAKQALEPKRPNCTWTTVRKNLEDTRNMKLTDLVKLSSQFMPNESELGAYLAIRTANQAEVQRIQNEKNLVRVIEGSFKSVVSPITGAIKTPAKMVDSAINATFQKAFGSQETYTGSPVADAIGTFTNTLVSKFLQRIFTKGFNPEADVIVSDFWTTGGVAAARLFFGELAEVDYVFNIGMRLDEFVIDGSAQFNGVIDDKFSRAVEQKCTLGQAIGYYKAGTDGYRAECNNLISGSAPFGFDADGQEVAQKNGLAYRSILVLRKFRIVPVGWELAAQYYKNFDKRDETLNLNKLVSKYNDQNSPYYKLVDPDWVLKFPLTRCVRQGAGPIKNEQDSYCDTVLEDGNCPEGHTVYPFFREDYCADYESCLSENSNSSCDVDNWGYCVEEKPIWKIKGTECKEKYYATCQTLTQEGSGQGGGQRISYLLNTVAGFTDGVCDSSNSGCREYCTDFNPVTKSWSCSAQSGNKIYLNSQVEICTQANEGCHLFYSSPAKDKEEVQFSFDERNNDPNAYGLLEENYLKLAAADYDCEGYTQPVFQYKDKLSCEDNNYFWRDDLRTCVVSGSDACANFVKYCQASDVSCQLYTPISTNDPVVPAVIDARLCSNGTNTCTEENVVSWNDECPEVCVGYESYYQSATIFEPGSNQDLIAATAKTCSQVDCDEFTNLDEVARGGEGIEYYSYLRQCIKPEDGGWETYYTYEGSNESGYQLRKWDLRHGPDGGPYYLSGGVCTNLEDKDCTEFFDEDLNSYKRYFSKTVSVSTDCHPFRRTLDQQVYMAIPAQGITCAATNAGCREYKSNSGYNYQKILEDYFSKGNLDGWNGNISNESVQRDDYSLEILSSVEHDLTLGDLEEGRLYTLEFLAKGSGSISAKFNGSTAEVSSNSENLINDGNWHHYKLNLPQQTSGGLTSSQINNNKLNIRTTNKIYIDNIILKKIENILLIKNSWNTPAICEVVSGGANHLGCQKYSDGDNNKINLRSFDKLCFEEVAGCQLVIDAQNTAAPEIEDDELEYLVLNDKFKCDEEQLGCQRLGLVTPNRDDGSYGFKDDYKIIAADNPLQFCQAGEVGCQTYKDDENNTYYFKDPLDKTCEYKQVDTNLGYQWYKSGSKELCPGNVSSGYCLGGRSVNDNNTCAANSGCTNLAYPKSGGICTDWVGLCSSNASGCREYQDPQEPLDCDKDLRNYDPDASADNLICNYYYYKDVESCDQGVNPSQGCVGFWETDNPDKNIRSYKVCSNNTDMVCNNDNDCPNGKCAYTNIQ